MKIKVSANDIEKFKTGALIVPVFDDKAFGAAAERLDKSLKGMVRRLVEAGDFKPKAGSVHLLYPEGRLAAERIILAGMGKQADLSVERLRHVSGRALAAARATRARDAAVLFDGIGFEPVDAGQAIAEGSILGLYRYLRYKTNEETDSAKDIASLTVLVNAKQVKLVQKGVQTGELVAGSASLARDMVSSPAADMTPAAIAAIARSMTRTHGLRVRVLDRPQMRALGMGALLGVSAGSAQPPKFIIVEHRKGGNKPWIALVGKTITFDSGGISLKPGEGMDKMKDDMSGGAAVLGAIRNAAALKLPLNIVALLPATENMPGGSALKPGDILTTLSGRTIEILNTDAEGRLILADALAYACRYKPEAIVDIATLTGACRVALGTEASGMLGNDEKLKEKIRLAGEDTGERVWELPLWDGYQELIKSDIADMKNTGGRDGGVITAACLLSRFVEKRPWVHLDIACTAWTEKDRPYTPKGATGIGVRLLTQFLRDSAKSSR